METGVERRNRESSILFMQQNHAATLKALHEEIHKLQKRCTDLTFQLTMHGINVEDGGNSADQLRAVQAQLAESRSQQERLRMEVAQRDAALQQLQHEWRVLRKRQVDEARLANQAVSGLQAEVEAKASNIAFLTTQIHRLKVQQRAADPPLAHLPAPPKHALASSLTRSRHQRGAPAVPVSASRRVSASASAESVEGGEVVGRSLRVNSAHSSGSVSPDISAFVQRPEPGLGVGVKKSAPLPPITSKVGEAGVLPQLFIANGGGAAGPGRGRQSTPEVTSLAVDQVSDANWKRPHQSHSSDYN